MIVGRAADGVDLAHRFTGRFAETHAKRNRGFGSSWTCHNLKPALDFFTEVKKNSGMVGVCALDDAQRIGVGDALSVPFLKKFAEVNQTISFLPYDTCRRKIFPDTTVTLLPESSDVTTKQ